MSSCSRTKITYCGNLAYSIWREADESTPYILEEHEEQPYDISIVMRYIFKTEQKIIMMKEECLTVEAEEVITSEDDELRMWIESTLKGFGVGLGRRKGMADVLMKKIWDKGVGYCRCYCELSSGPKIVMEIVDDDVPPPPPPN